MMPSTREDGARLQILCHVNPDCFAGEFGELNTFVAVITSERLGHIQTHHPQDYALFETYGRRTIENPDIVLVDDKHESTVFMISKLEATNLNAIVRLSVAGKDDPKLMNSVMTFYRIRGSNLDKLMAKHKLLYRKPGK